MVEQNRQSSQNSSELELLFIQDGMPAQDKERENSQFKHLEKLSAQYGLNLTHTNAIYRCIIDLVIARHEEIAN